MIQEESVNELKEKILCYECIGEQFLSAEVQQNGARKRCSYCGCLKNSYTIGEIAERVETAFGEHFRRTSDQPSYWQLSLLSDREENYDWERDGEPAVWAIANAGGFPDQAAQDVQGILEYEHSDFDSAAIGEETEFGSESHYEEKEPNDYVWQEDWRLFEQSLKTEARFFSQFAAAHLTSVFGGIDTLSTSNGQPLVIEVGPGTEMSAIYRARVFQSSEGLEEALRRPDLHLASPPAVHAKPGRMNASGISVFYGANADNVAVAEVRPPVGSQVAVARFEIVRRLRLLDLNALGTVAGGGRIFDPDSITRLERATFLRSLCQRLIKPVMPNDEIFEYLPTQAIADFLATENEPLLDGIIFPSVQAAGDALNVVLFHKAARVAELEIPDGTEIDVYTGCRDEDGWEFDYSVTERVPPDNRTETTVLRHQTSNLRNIAARASHTRNADLRETTLRVDTDSIKVHIVQSVQFQSQSYCVRRERKSKQDTNS